MASAQGGTEGHSSERPEKSYVFFVFSTGTSQASCSGSLFYDMNKKTLHAALATIGRKGGKARAKKLTAARRIEIAREAGKASGRKRKERK